ncbi:MAG: SPASM domain-containing protein [Candidatus Helarchaeota archaeon]
MIRCLILLKLPSLLREIPQQTITHGLDDVCEVSCCLGGSGSSTGPATICGASLIVCRGSEKLTKFIRRYVEVHTLGNALERPLREIWHDNGGVLGKFRDLRQCDLKGKCKDCGFVPRQCNGGCRAAALVAGGDFYGEDPFCWKA